jgi:putative ABC transport system permease protein
MFDKDRWQEIYYALRKNKLRTLLTAFGVFWGIFMLVIMLGSGNGLRNGITKVFGDFATNSMFIWPQTTSEPYMGLQKGRNWSFTNEDTKALLDNIPEIEVLAPRVHPPNGRNTFVRGKNTGVYRINGDYPGYNKIDPVIMLQGRYINDNDIADKRKVVVIGNRVREVLFTPDENPIGKYIEIQGVYYQVIGVFKSKHTQGWGNSQNESATMPFTTLQKNYNLGNIVFYYSMLSKSNYSVTELEPHVKQLLARRHKISPTDNQAFGCENVQREYNQMNGLFTGINMLTWFVGVLTLIAGVIGISNIMLVIIRERTKEIGIQRAIGATPRKIIGQIILESVTLTFIAGLIGMIFGVMIIEAVNVILIKTGAQLDSFSNPEVDLKAVVSSFIILVIAGTFAGMIPARRAIKIKPIEALRTEL